MKALYSGANIVITLMLVGVATGLVLVVLPIFGNRALIVRSASMGPTIPVGSLVAVEPKTSLLSPQQASLAPKYNAGNVIAFRNETSQKIITTHRIVGTRIKNGEVFYQTKGDANNTPDSQLVAEKDVIGTTWFSVPFIGKLFAFTKSNVGFPLLVIFPAFLVIIFETINIFKEFKKQKLAYQNQFSPNIGVSGLKILLPLVVSVLVIQNSFAYFSDTATSANNVFTTGQFAPNPGDIVINEIMWMGTQGDAADEWIELRNMTGNTINLSNWVVDNLGSGVTNNIVIPSGKNIAPNGFFLIANDTKETGNHNIDPDLVVNVSLQNPGEQLRLRTSAGGTIIDTADNDSGGWFAGVDPGGQNPERSMERNDVPGDGTVVSNWHSATAQVNMDPGARELATPKSANSSP